MKKLSILFISVVALATSFISCSYDDNSTPAPAPTTLELTIKDQTGVFVPGAVVKLYKSLADMQNPAVAPVATATSSTADGKVTFNTGLEAIIYFYDVTKGCQSNQFSPDYKT